MFKKWREKRRQKKVGIEVEFGSRKLRGKARFFVTTVAILMSFYHLYTSGIGVPTAMLHRSRHLAFALFLCFLYFPYSNKARKDRVAFIDWIFAILGGAFALYSSIFYNQLMFRVGNPTNIDLIFGIGLILFILEATRRSVSPALPVITLVFIIYVFLGPWMPELIEHRGYGIRRLIDHLFLTMEGIWGVPIGVSSTYVFLFVLFGAFLERTGAGDYLLKLSFATMGRFRGGPAKAAVVASALMGTVSGSSIANTVTTGSMTIPLMKKVGFRKEMAGAVEVAASTNGQLMPPVMGAAAFIMAEFTDIPYFQIIKHAIIPAVLSYIAIFSIIHLEAIKTGIGRLPKEEIPPVLKTFFSGAYLLIPLAFLIYVLLVLKLTPTTSAFISIMVSIAVALIENNIRYPIRYLKTKKSNPSDAVNDQASIEETKFNPWIGGTATAIKLLLQAMEMGARNMIGIAAACACCGIIVGVVTLTGLGLKMTLLIVTLAQGKLFLTLLFAVFASIILGMGLPTTATYIIMAAMTAPAILEVGADLGVPLIAAHLFVFYYGIVADDTPPVGLCAYAAAGIAHSDPIKTGIQSFKLDAAAFTLPFIYLYNPQLLMINTSFLNLLMIIPVAIVGMFLFAAGIQGFLLVKTRLWERLSLFVIAIFLIKPGFFTDILGAAWLALILLLQVLRRKK
ncbi:MAG: C4-dicarboxylate ABC transporter permease, partial [Spirochaetes bacterium]